MSKFIGEDFMLTNKVAEELYHEHAAKLPIIDYHCHLVPEQIAGNYQARNITEMWLGGDHYKWRAMRGNGVSEDYITGDKSDYEKFEKWAYTLQYSMRNPLYHWTHLELSRIFGIDEVLNPSSARKIYDECNQKINSEEFRAQAIMRSCNVEVVCTTDDPIDNLEYHKQIADNPFGTKVLPTWRADKVLAIDNPEAFNQYIDKLAAAADMDIATYEDLMAALANRQDFFAS
ncbi:MAG: glucuronate isomerase, partial [Rikenellaceae bacterium]